MWHFGIFVFHHQQQQHHRLFCIRHKIKWCRTLSVGSCSSTDNNSETYWQVQAYLDRGTRYKVETCRPIIIANWSVISVSFRTFLRLVKIAFISFMFRTILAANKSRLSLWCHWHVSRIDYCSCQYAKKTNKLRLICHKVMYIGSRSTWKVGGRVTGING